MLPAVPVILLDADFDPVIAAKFFWPDVRMVEIPVRQQAEIIQVCDRSCSMRFLLGGKEDDQQRANNRLAEVQRFAGRVLAEGGLFVTYKAALERMTLPAGVDAVHLGNLRGRDGYKHHDVAVIAGRLEPSVEILERLARCMFGDEAEPLTLVQPGERDIRRYPTEQRRYRMAGGAGRAGRRRERASGPARAGAAGAGARARARAGRGPAAACAPRPAGDGLRALQHPAEPGVTTVTTWNALARDREAEACRRWAGVWLASASERAKAAPDLWANCPGGGERVAAAERGIKPL